MGNFIVSSVPNLLTWTTSLTLYSTWSTNKHCAQISNNGQVIGKENEKILVHDLCALPKKGESFGDTYFVQLWSEQLEWSSSLVQAMS